MEAAKHCLRYLSGTVDLFITYRGDADQRDGQERNALWGWVDADYAADLNTRRSHTGYILMLNGGPVSWKSTRQKSVSLSTAESEWYAASEAGKEILICASSFTTSVLAKRDRPHCMKTRERSYACPRTR